MSQNIVIVAAAFNKTIVEPMIESAVAEIEKQEGNVEKIIRVPGAYEIPIIMDQVLEKKEVHGAIALGYIERGETLHGEVMGHVIHKALVDMQLAHRKPIGLGIIGPGATLEQAEKRNVNYGRASAIACLETLTLVQANSPG